MVHSNPVLITGGAGYIGSHAVLAFRDAGTPIVVLDDLSTGRRERVPGDVPFVEGDAGAVVPLHEHRWGRFVQLLRPPEKPGADASVDRLLTPHAAAPEAAREARGRPGLRDQ